MLHIIQLLYVHISKIHMAEIQNMRTYTYSVYNDFDFITELVNYELLVNYVFMTNYELLVNYECVTNYELLVNYEFAQCCG